MRSQWAVLLSGILWMVLFFLSVRSTITDLLPAWLLPVLWFALPPGPLLIYAFSISGDKYSVYPRYKWDMRSWTVTSAYLWIFQSGLLIAHMIRFGFFEPLSLRTAIVGVVASTIAGIMWVDAFWTDVIKVYRLKPYSTIRDYISVTSSEFVPRKRSDQQYSRARPQNSEEIECRIGTSKCTRAAAL